MRPPLAAIALVATLHVAGMPPSLAGDAAAKDAAAAGCQAQEPGYVRSAPGQTCRIGLPATPATVQIPDGWVCGADSMATFGDETMRTLNCIPIEGGSPISLAKMFAAQQPASLEAFLDESVRKQAELPAGSSYFVPRIVELAGAKAVETAYKSVAQAHHDGSGDGRIELVLHTLTFEHATAFYQCELMASPGSYTKPLRQTFMDFCGSIRFDGTAIPSGND